MPTLEAELLYPRALAILEDLQKLADDLSAAGKTVSGQLIIGASTIPSAFIIPRIAADFKKKHSDISFEIRTFDSAQVVNAVLNNELLLGIVGAKIVSPKLHYHTFRNDNLVLAVSTERKIERQITTRTLRELPFILREEGSGTRRALEKHLVEKDMRVDQLSICAVLGSSTAITEAVKSNLGVSILSRHAIEDAVKHNQIQTVDIIDMQMTRNFYTVTARKRSLPHHYKAFLKYLLPENN